MPTHPRSRAGHRTHRSGILPAAAATLAGVAVLFAAAAAHAGAAVATGPIDVGAGQSYGCRVANTSSSRELLDVAIRIRRANGSTAASTSCLSVAPLAVCDITSAITPGPGRVWCEVTAIGSKRSMRVTLSNDVTGASADGS